MKHSRALTLSDRHIELNSQLWRYTRCGLIDGKVDNTLLRSALANIGSTWKHANRGVPRCF
jgi:hypothetical protein